MEESKAYEQQLTESYEDLMRYLGIYSASLSNSSVSRSRSTEIVDFIETSPRLQRQTPSAITQSKEFNIVAPVQKLFFDWNNKSLSLPEEITQTSLIKLYEHRPQLFADFSCLSCVMERVLLGNGSDKDKKSGKEFFEKIKHDRDANDNMMKSAATILANKEAYDAQSDLPFKLRMAIVAISKLEGDNQILNSLYNKKGEQIKDLIVGIEQKNIQKFEKKITTGAFLDDDKKKKLEQELIGKRENLEKISEDNSLNFRDKENKKRRLEFRIKEIEKELNPSVGPNIKSIAAELQEQGKHFLFEVNEALSSKSLNKNDKKILQEVEQVFTNLQSEMVKKYDETVSQPSQKPKF